jgi:predicted RNA-binding protein with PIN domain
MSVHIVIDGYNLIRQSPTLSSIEHRSLEEGREALLQRLVSYKKVRHHPVTVVFDGADTDHSAEARRQWKGIHVLFSRPGELADSVIKRMVTQERERAVVVTSDREIADFAAELGAATMDSAAFEIKMNAASHTEMNHTDLFEEEAQGWKPTTKKKGPSRRLTKRQRKSRIKTKKL